MKHLKKYKLFESTDMSEIEDVLEELTDIGFKYKISTYNTTTTEISIRDTFKKYIEINQLKESILRIQDILGKNIELLLTDRRYSGTFITDIDENNLIVGFARVGWNHFNNKRDILAVSIIIRE